MWVELIMDQREYLFVKLIEEAAEMQQAATKALTFGLQSTYPGSQITNETQMINEFIECGAIMKELMDAGFIRDVGEEYFNGIIANKLERLESSMQLSRILGTLK